MEILRPGESERYLGRTLCVIDYHATEVDHWIALGLHLLRASFTKFKSEFWGKHVSFKNKMKLFQCVTSPVFMEPQHGL